MNIQKDYSVEILEIDGQDLTELPSDLLQYTNLIILNCKNNRITDLVNLPPTLLELYCGYNEITEFPPNSLPESLLLLHCNINYITDLDNLPLNLKELDCGNNEIFLLDYLPPTLNTLFCHSNHIPSLDHLPRTLEILYCSDNAIMELDHLPSTLRVLECGKNFITLFKSLPDLLHKLSCEYNQLTSIHNIPPELSELICNNNDITALGILPITLDKLKCKNNPVLDQYPYLGDTSKPLIERIKKYNAEITTKKGILQGLTISKQNKYELLHKIASLRIPLLKTGFDPISYSPDENIADFLAENTADNIAIYYIKQYYLLKRSYFTKQNNTFYECKKVASGLLPKREDVNETTLLFNSSRVGIPSLYIPENYIDTLQQSKSRYFVLLDTGISLKSVISRDIWHKYLTRDPTLNLVSGSHCQAGQDGHIGILYSYTNPFIKHTHTNTNTNTKRKRKRESPSGKTLVRHNTVKQRQTKSI